MSSFNSRIIPLIIVTGVGIWNGMYVFEPAFKEQQEQREKTFEKQHASSEIEGSQELATQDFAAKTPSANPADRQNDALAFSQQPVTPNDASGSSSWFKNWGLAWPGSRANGEAEQPKHNPAKSLVHHPSAPNPQDKSED
ncbi:uncharacterized protein BKCO1_4400068 [Diplodia corticola]|uniref:Uncharacterized protein n=1 Tax=Diplodia corticola TaxID=236234 RepID=A0A1J9QS48_9PEZI|nr:uncharacterized protein BKCO1_4400068 [Diplodia corticola]OJD31782.1 hypothetical protein BKCO1_4400068 [Diplodia corticola]